MTDPHPDKPTKPVLAIETSTGVARVALVDAKTGARLFAAEAPAERHSSNLLRLCVEVMERARVAAGDLGGIACGAGPGSFTGLRVGLAVAKGLAMPAELPLILVSSLQALARDMRSVAHPGERLLPCLDAGKGQVFVGLFDAVAGAAGASDEVSLRGAEYSVAPEQIAEQIPDDAPAVCAGPGAVRYRDVLTAALGTRGRVADVTGPSADAIAAIALVRLARGESDDLGTAVPSYGRAPDITQPRRPPR